MEDVALFFWQRWCRASQIGGSSQWNAVEWQEAYASTLSSKKQKDFWYHWNKFNDAAQKWHDGTDKYQKNNVHPINL